MNYSKEYYKTIHIETYLYRSISEWLNDRYQTQDQNLYPGGPYTADQYQADIQTLEASQCREKQITLITDPYTRISLYKILNYLKTGTFEHIPALVLYGLVPAGGYLNQYTNDPYGVLTWNESTIFRHIEEELFHTTRENRHIYVWKLIELIAEINKSHQQTIRRTIRTFYLENGEQLTGKTGNPAPRFNPRTARINQPLIEARKNTQRTLYQLKRDVMYFKTKIYKMLQPYHINLAQEAQKYNLELFTHIETNLLKQLDKAHPYTDQELGEAIEKNIRIDELKPPMTPQNKPILSQNQIIALFETLKQSHVFNKALMRQTMDIAISLLTGYSDKQIHKKTNTPLNEILETRATVTHIQEVLRQAIDKLEQEKKTLIR